VPERPVDVATTTAAVAEALGTGAHALLVAGEGVEGLPGILEAVAEGAGTRLRLVRLGHAQRGGAPTVRDRAAAAAYATLAVEAIAEGRSGIAALSAGSLSLVPFAAHADAPAPDERTWRGLL